MRSKLYPNIKRMTSVFCISLLCVTLTVLTLRLTVLSDMAVVAGEAAVETSANSQGDPGGDEAAFSYQINRKIQFASAQAKGNVLIANPETNEHYMRVDIILNDTGRSVYYSGDILPGAAINSVPLQTREPLEEGVYECTAYITIHDRQTKERIGDRVEEPVTLYIGVKPEK